MARSPSSLPRKERGAVYDEKNHLSVDSSGERDRRGPAFCTRRSHGGGGTLTLDKKTYTLKRALAYETTIDDEDAIAVVLSGQPVSSEMLKEARDAEKEGGDPGFKRPFLRLVFKKTGELKYWSAAAGGTMLGRRSGEATGELTAQDGQVKGKASQPTESEGMFPSGFEAHFDVALLKAGQSLPASTARKGGPAANVKPTVSGIFRGNGKEAKLAYVSAQWREPFNGKPGIMLVFTEKDHSKEKKPDMGAMFGKYGSGADYLHRRRWRHLWLPGRSQRSPKAGL